MFNCMYTCAYCQEASDLHFLSRKDRGMKQSSVPPGWNAKRELHGIDPVAPRGTTAAAIFRPLLETTT
jgi:hypothetical protein